jgi:hypothetical protein
VVRKVDTLARVWQTINPPYRVATYDFGGRDKKCTS